MVYHTKFNNGTEGFEVRVRQLFVNSKGWLVASPFRFTGLQTRQSDIESRRMFSPEKIAGTYSLLYHPYRLDHNNMKEAVPMKVTLSADGKVSGERSGSWEYSEDGKSFVKIRLADVEYNGVAILQNVDGYADMPAVCFSAVSNTGVPVWLYKYGPEEAVADACSQIVGWAGSESSLISSDAPVADNVEIEYTAVNADTGNPEPETLSPEGVYTMTADGHRISVSARCVSGGCFLECGPFTRATKGENYVAPEMPVYYPESSRKNLDAGWWSNFSTEDYLLELGACAEFAFDVFTDEAANWHSWCLYGASKTHGASGYVEYFGIRNDNWDNTSGSNRGCVSDFDWNSFCPEMNGSRVRMKVEYSDDALFTMTSVISGSSGVVYNYSYSTTIQGKPYAVTLFFVNEKSYIDGSELASGDSVSDVVADPSDCRMYNLFGQPVDEDYKGLVVKNGKKYLLK